MAATEGGRANNVNVSRPPPAHDGDKTRRGATIDVTGHDVVQATEAVLGES